MTNNTNNNNIGGFSSNNRTSAKLSNDAKSTSYKDINLNFEVCDPNYASVPIVGTRTSIKKPNASHNHH